jgi:hypothetical protein
VSATNPVRPCLGCSQSDDHPKHMTASPDGAFLAYHMDCCAIARNCEICAAQLDGVGGPGGNPKGEKLRQHLMTLGPGADQPGWTAPSDDELGLTPAQED